MSGRIAGLCLVAVAAGLFMFGCGSRSCGEGTVEMDGECVAEPAVMCADGTMEVDGTCTAAQTECGPGTTPNADTGACDPDIAECAPGTVAMGSECVPDGTMICEDGTTYDADTGTCVITDAACGAGAVLIDGECVPADAALMPEIDSVEPDDPEFEGTPVAVTLPAEGDQVTLGGCIVPADLDMDDSLDPDVDFFTVDVTAPTLLRVNADGLGGASAAFAVFPEEGSALDDVGWFRVGINLVGDTSSRQIYLPSAGTYTVQVFDSRSVALESLAGGSFGIIRAVGTADTCYFVTVENMAIPSPTALSPGERVGTVTEAPVFYELSPSARTIYRSDLTDDSPVNFMGQVMDAGGAVSVGQGALASPPVDAGSTVRLVVDHIVNLSLDPVQYTLELSEIPEIPSDGTVTFTHDSADDPGVFVGFEATAGDVVHFAFDSFTQPVEIGVFGPELGGGFAVCADSSGALVAETNCELWYVVRQSGTQMVRVWNPSSADGFMYDVDFDITVNTPVDLTLGTPSTVTFTDERAFARIDLTSTTWAAFTPSLFTGTAFTSADFAVFDGETTVLSRTDAGGTDSATPLRDEVGIADGDSFSEIYGPDFGPVALIQVSDPGGYDSDESIELVVSPEVFTDLMVDPSTPVTRAGDAVSGSAPTYYLVRGVPFGDLTFEVTGTGGTDPVLHRIDPAARPITTNDATGADGVEAITARLPEDGWLAFAVDATGGGTVDVSATQTAPSYTVAPGVTRYSSACPSLGGAGEVVRFTVDDGTGFAPADDGLTTPYTFSTFVGGTFFGDPATGMIVSSNGWFTFDTSYSGHSGGFLGIDDLDDPSNPNALVAPMWNDLFTDELCVLEEPGQVIVEWRGAHWSGAPLVEMQVVFKTDGTIEFVYGAGHTMGETDATPVGLQSPDGTDAISASGVTGGSSIVFTPWP